MLKILKFLLLIFCISSCSTTKPTLQKNEVGKCFKFIFENNLKEFKENKTECKAYTNQNGMTTLMMAISKDKNDFAEFLMDEKVDVNQTDHMGFTALIFAANKNNARLAQLLRRNGARIEIVQENLTGLMMAVRNSSLELIRVLNASPVEINIKASDGWTALYFAISRSDEEVLKYLLQQGACQKMKDSYNQSPRDFAEELKWIEGLKILKRFNKC